MQLQVLMFKQDDPRKCSAQKLVKFKLAKDIKKISSKSIVLDPFSQKTLLRNDNKNANSITAIDCSWEHAENIFHKSFSGIHRKLPPLFAGNPINYSKLNKLTTVEALAGALFILGYDEHAKKLLDKFKWGHTFYELNKNLLNEYSQIDSETKIDLILNDYGILG